MQIQKLISDNFIDDSLVNCFSPIHTTQVFLGSTRINIRNRLVKTPSVFEKLYTLICIVAVSFSFGYFELTYYLDFHDKDTTVFIACIIGAFVQHASYLSNMINVRFCNSKLAVKIFNKLQKIDNILPLNEIKNLKIVQYHWNIAGLLLIIVPFLCGYIIHVFATVDYPILTVFSAMGLLSIYLELLLAGSLISYLTIRLRFLNKIIQYNLHMKHGDCKSRQTPVVVIERFIISSELNADNNLDLNKFVMCLKEILKLYKMINEVFSYPVFNIAATLFFWALLVIQAMIIGLRTELLSVIAIITIGLWILFYIFLLTALAVVIDYFVKEVKQIQLHCIQAMSYRFDGPIWKGANEILRTIQFSQPVFSVYGIFVVDKTLPLKLIGIITTNVVVLLQFTMHS